MLNRFSEWISERDFAAALFADLAVLSAVFTPLAGLVLALVTLRKGFWAGCRVLAYAILILAGLIALELTAPKVKPGLSTAGIFSLIELTGFWLVLVLLATLIRSGRSLSLVVELTSLVGLAGVLAFQALVPNPRQYWSRWFQESMGHYLVHQPVYQTLGRMLAAHAPWLVGSFAAVFVLVVSLLLLAARWLQARLEQPGRFGDEFRNFRCGYAASFLFAVVVVVAAVARSDLFDNFSFVLAVMFIYQGLAVLQRWVKSHPRLAWGRLLVYLLLVSSFLGSVLGPPVSLLAMVGENLWVVLMLVGFFDNFFPRRLPSAAA
jgi:hypothetical protein